MSSEIPPPSTESSSESQSLRGDGIQAPPSTVVSSLLPVPVLGTGVEEVQVTGLGSGQETGLGQGHGQEQGTGQAPGSGPGQAPGVPPAFAMMDDDDNDELPLAPLPVVITHTASMTKQITDPQSSSSSSSSNAHANSHAHTQALEDTTASGVVTDEMTDNLQVTTSRSSHIPPPGNNNHEYTLDYYLSSALSSALSPALSHVPLTYQIQDIKSNITYPRMHLINPLSTILSLQTMKPLSQ